MRMIALVPLALLAQPIWAAAQVTTVCSLYGNTAYCTTDNQAALIAEQQREQYEAGAATGSAVGSAIFYHHFPAWRRKHCSKYPGQPFNYHNLRGDSITGRCPTLEGLANEVATEWIAKNRNYEPNPANGQTMVAYVAEHHLSFFETKSYDKAFRYLRANGPMASDQLVKSQSAAGQTPKTGAGSVSHDVFVWFDEPAPPPGAPLFEVLVTARAYDGALTILRQARQGNTSVQAGKSVLDTNFHPATESLESWQKSNSGQAPSLFYWQGEEVNGATSVMHFQMTKRAYEQMLALVAGSDLRVRPSQPSDKGH